MCKKKKREKVSVLEDVCERWKDKGFRPIEVIYEDYPEDPSKKDSELRQIVFIDEDYDLDWFSSDPLDLEKKKLLSKVMSLTSLPYKFCSEDKRKSFLRYLGQGIVSSFVGDEENAEKCIRQANAFHKKTLLEWNRKIVLVTSLACLLLALLVFKLFQSTVVDSVVLTSMFCGFLGAFLSITCRNSAKNNAASTDACLIVLEVIVRLVVGLLFALVAYLFAICPVLKINDLFFSLPYGFAAVSLIAGFSEKFIPNLIGKYENKFSKED